MSEAEILNMTVVLIEVFFAGVLFGWCLRQVQKEREKEQKERSEKNE